MDSGVGVATTVGVGAAVGVGAGACVGEAVGDGVDGGSDVAVAIGVGSGLGDGAGVTSSSQANAPTVARRARSTTMENACLTLGMGSER